MQAGTRGSVPTQGQESSNLSFCPRAGAVDRRRNPEAEKGERGPAISQYPHQATKLIAAEYAKFLGPDWYTGDDESVTIYGRCGEEILLDEASGTSIAELDGAWWENGSAGSREIWKMRLLQGYCQLLHIIIHLVQDVVG